MTAPRRSAEQVVGVISDTHGVIRPQALDALKGSTRILHAGDIGAPEVLIALAAIAPVTAIRGNNDRAVWARRLPETAIAKVDGASIYLVHDVHDLDADCGGFAAVVAGHSHRPSIDERQGVLFVNPGSAGPRRFSLPVAVARLYIRAGRVRGEIVLLTV